MGVFIIILTLIFFIPIVSFSQQEDTAAEIRELRQRLDRLERKLAVEAQVRKKETKELEEKTSTLAGEVEKASLSRFIPEKAELKGEYGLGPAASSVYRTKHKDTNELAAWLAIGNVLLNLDEAITKR